MEKFFKLKENGTTARTGKEKQQGDDSINGGKNLLFFTRNGKNAENQRNRGDFVWVLLKTAGSYPHVVNPNLLTGFDVGSALWNGVFLATCLASAFAMFCMAFLATMAP